MDKNVKFIVFTGGPSGGKTRAIPYVRKHLEKMGWYVVVIGEMATMYDSAGIGPTKFVSPLETVLDFQRELVETQLRLERSALALVRNLADDVRNVAILCDRALCDQIAYIGEEQLEGLLRQAGVGSIHDAKNRYDAVIHMVTAADGAESFYVNKDQDPDSPRSESIEGAREHDVKTKRAWLGHAHQVFIDNSTDFAGKVERSLEAVSRFLGIPEPYEVERKFLIKMPPLDRLYTLDFKECVIRQAYLVSDDPECEERVRMEVGDGGVRYTHTFKTGTGLKRVEVERDITSCRYRELEQRLDFTRRAIVKTRYRMLYANQIIEIDIYPNWTRHAILEVELRSEDDAIELPPFVEVVCEVTDDKKYSNYALALDPLRL